MSDAATTHGSTPRPGLPATYSDADPGGTSVASHDARPGLEPVPVGTGPRPLDDGGRVAGGGPANRIAEAA